MGEAQDVEEALEILKDAGWKITVRPNEELEVDAGTLKLESPGLGFGTRITIDGQKPSFGVRHAVVDVGMDEIPSVTLEGLLIDTKEDQREDV